MFLLSGTNNNVLKLILAIIFKSIGDYMSRYSQFVALYQALQLQQQQLQFSQNIYIYHIVTHIECYSLRLNRNTQIL